MTEIHAENFHAIPCQGFGKLPAGQVISMECLGLNIRSSLAGGRLCYQKVTKHDDSKCIATWKISNLRRNIRPHIVVF